MGLLSAEGTNKIQFRRLLDANYYLEELLVKKIKNFTMDRLEQKKLLRIFLFFRLVQNEKESKGVLWVLWLRLRPIQTLYQTFRKKHASIDADH